MSTRGFSGTTVAIIVLLLVALFGIGHIPGVNPPPAQPEKPAAAPSTSDAVKNTPSGMSRMAEMMAEKKKEMQAMASKYKGAGQHVPRSKPLMDPTTIIATPDHFRQVPDGPQGIQKTQEVLAKEKAEYDRARREAQQYIHPNPSAASTPNSLSAKTTQ
ncbi:MAG TPA: hypothetical protein VFA07_06815 [Chthonomonadaceae bacterium]|nr:hypothetical protein [Chthonomonadaceae bacterium]